VIIAAAATPVGPTQEDLLIQIRDLLKNKSTATLYVPLNHRKRWFFFVVTIVTFCYLL
jgi:hypothetical protein